MNIEIRTIEESIAFEKYTNSMQKDFGKIGTNPKISKFMSCVVISGSDGTVDYAKSKQNIREVLSSMHLEYKAEMYMLRLFLTRVANGPMMTVRVAASWWYENNYRLKKIIVVSLVLEAANRRLIITDDPVVILDIPLCICAVARWMADISKSDIYTSIRKEQTDGWEQLPELAALFVDS